MLRTIILRLYFAWERLNLDIDSLVTIVEWIIAPVTRKVALCGIVVFVASVCARRRRE